MASLTNRLRFPDDRTTFIFQGAFRPILTPPITSVVVYADQAATTLADILDPSGNPIPGSTLHTDISGMLPEFYGPVGNVVRVWAGVPGASGTPSPLDAQFQAVVAVTPTILTGQGPPSTLPAGTNIPLGSIYLDTNLEMLYAPYGPSGWPTGQSLIADGGNLVTQVAGVNPDSSGHVALTASNVGADPAGTASTAQSAAQTFATNAVATETSRAQTAEALLAPKASPTFTGVPAVPTAAALTNTTQIASTAYTDAAVGVETTRATAAEATKATTSALTTEVSRAEAAEALLAPLASPALTGTPTVPTASALTNTTQAASTAYADAAVGVEKARALAAEALLAPLASPALTGTPTGPTKSALTNSTALATTAYADTAVGVETTRAQAAEAGREIVAPPAVLSRGRATVITTYASGHGWTANGFASSNVNDTSDGRLSGQMLTGTTTGNSGNFPTFTKTGASALNISGNCVRVWVKVDVPTNVTAITLRVADTGGLAANRYISWTALASSGGVYRTNGVLIPANTWTELSFSLGSAFTSGSPNLAALTEYRWICQDNGTAFTAHFGGIEVFSALGERYPNGVVLLGFDDCWAGQYNLAMNVLSAYGYPATIFPIVDQVGQTGSWTLAQLQQMVNIGWEVAPHASTLSNHSNWNTLTNAQQTADVIASQAWIAGQGFGLSGAYAYPLGGFNGGADAAVASLVQVARTIDSTLLTETLPIGNPLHMRSAAGVGGTGGIGVTTYTTASTGVIALAKAAGALIPITFHDISSGTSTNINQCSIADFTTLVAAIASAGMAVATYAEVLHYALSAMVSPTFYEYQVINLPTDLAAKAPLASPTFTGTPAAPTASALTNTTQVATTAYADAAVSVEKTRALAAEALLAPLASPSFTGSPSFAGINSMTPLIICGRSTTFGAPTTGTWATNDAIMDVSGDWYYCTAGGTPGTWRALAMGGSTVRQNGLAAMNVDLLTVNDSFQLTAGTIYFASVYVENPIASVGHIFCRMATAGASITNSFVGIYDVLTGNRLGLSADVSSTFTGATGMLSLALTAGVTGLTWNQQLYVAVLVGSGGTTPPTLVSTVTGSSNIGQSSNFRFLKSTTTSNTSLPSTVPTLTASTTGKMTAFALGI